MSACGCGCAWCCCGVPSDQRGNAHKQTCRQIDEEKEVTTREGTFRASHDGHTSAHEFIDKEDLA